MLLGWLNVVYTLLPGGRVVRVLEKFNAECILHEQLRVHNGLELIPATLSFNVTSKLIHKNQISPDTHSSHVFWDDLGGCC